ncbi:MAG: putative oxidoreductase [Verrucomicrobiota bacterium]|jgi:putative oxidoreductase|nr:putative oxidoreductase [Verrucomicrobiota bacterium]MDK2964387.1 putative oxidoreductase [Verrucomicrobiota bacterium]
MTTKTVLFGTTADANLGILILRVFIGAALMTHGVPKLLNGLGASGWFTQMVAGLGVPAPQVMAFLAAFAESFGALLLAIGLLTRPAAFMILCTMGVAVFGALGGQPFAKQELAWLYFFPALLFLLKGAGKWSLDCFISRK